MAKFFLKTHDTGKSIVATLMNGDGTVINLAGCSVKIIISTNVGATATVNRAVTVTDAANGIVTYTPLAADVATAGTYMAEWEVTTAGALVFTVPDPGYDTIQIDQDLG
jgi:hypothetical protein